jgi:hypothetical protein
MKCAVTPENRGTAVVFRTAEVKTAPETYRVP